MNGEAKGSLRYRARTTTALATTALVAGGYLVMSGTIAKAAEEVSVNEARKEDRFVAAGPSSNTAGKEGKLTAPSAGTSSAAASSNEAGKGGKLIATGAGSAGASSNTADKGGKLTATGASNAAASSNTAGKGGKLIAAGAGASNAVANSNATGNEGKIIRVLPVASQVDDQDEQYVDSYAERKTANTSAADLPGSTTTAGSYNPKSNLDEKGDLFRPGPDYDKQYNAQGNVDVYGKKENVATARPILEIGREQYTSGDYKDESSIFGSKNLVIPGLAVFGDWRTAVAYNQNNGNDVAQIATRVNIDVDFKITGTERIHAFFTPLQDNAKFTRCEFGGGGVAEENCFLEFDPNPQTLFFEGDIGSIYAGLSGKEASFDLPVTAGLFPLFLQNGIWANDAILGGAVSLTAKNSRALGLPNYDVTFFTAFDNVDNALIKSDVTANRNNNIANIYGVTAFIDAFDGYIETGYGLIQGVDDNVDGQLTNFVTAAYTRRFANTLSNTTRVFANFGNGIEDEGVAVISENSFVTSLPSTLLPYANFFVGSGNPQPLVDGNGAGILKNVGINFETDALTNFPKLNDTGSNAFGGAIGLQYLFNLDQQIVVELASVQPFGDPILGVGAAEAQYALGIRYQIPLNKDWLFRADATYQIKEEQGEDDFGIRSELRRKF